jgi:flagellar protein FliO/FliZ
VITKIRGTILCRLTALFLVTLVFSASLFAQDAAGLADANTSVDAAVSGTSESSIVLGTGDASLPAAANSAATGVWDVLRIVLLLVVAAAAVYGLVYFLKRSGRKGERGNPHLKVLAQAALGTKGAVFAVSVGTQAWLIGAGETGQPALIAEINDKEAIDAMQVDYSAAQGAEKRIDFRSLLSRFGSVTQGAAQGASVSDASGIRTARERLRNL